MKATYENFTGTAGQKNFALDIVNSALWLLDKKIEQNELKTKRYIAEGADANFASLRKSLAAYFAKKDQIEAFLVSGKKVSAKKVIEGSKKNDAAFMSGQGWVIEIEL